MSNDKPRPEINEVRIAVKCFEAVKDGANSVREVASRLGMGNDKIYRALNSVEKSLGISLIFRGRGENAVFNKAAEPAIIRLYGLIESFDTAFSSSQGQAIVIGAGISACTSILARVSEKFMREFASSEVRFVFGKPAKLFRMYRAGEIDLLLAPFDPLNDPTGDQTRQVVNFKMSVIAHCRHAVIGKIAASGNCFDWGMLEGERVAVLDSRSHFPEYPEQIFRPGQCRVSRYENLLLLHAIVSAGGGVAFSLPQFLTDQQRTSVRVFDYEGAAQLKFALMQFSRPGADGDAVEHLSRLIGSELQRIQSPYDARLYKDVQSSKTCFHVSSTPLGKQWIQGEFDLHFGADSKFYGDFRFVRFVDDTAQEFFSRELSTVLERRYSVEGFVEANVSGTSFHFSGQGSLADFSNEVFSIHFIAESRMALANGTMFGLWAGRQTEMPNSPYGFRPDFGYSVLCSDPNDLPGTDSKSLNDLVRDKFGDALKFELPEVER